MKYALQHEWRKFEEFPCQAKLESITAKYLLIVAHPIDMSNGQLFVNNWTGNHLINVLVFLPSKNYFHWCLKSLVPLLIYQLFQAERHWGLKCEYDAGLGKLATPVHFWILVNNVLMFSSNASDWYFVGIIQRRKSIRLKRFV